MEDFIKQCEREREEEKKINDNLYIIFIFSLFYTIVILIHLL